MSEEAKHTQTTDVWVENPPDNSGLKIDILPTGFRMNGFCCQCGGSLDVEMICTRCNADHWPALKRNLQRRQAQEA